jgi:hypothetical protein
MGGNPLGGNPLQKVTKHTAHRAWHSNEVCSFVYFTTLRSATLPNHRLLTRTLPHFPK